MLIMYNSRPCIPRKNAFHLKPFMESFKLLFYCNNATSMYFCYLCFTWDFLVLICLGILVFTWSFSCFQLFSPSLDLVLSALMHFVRFVFLVCSAPFVPCISSYFHPVSFLSVWFSQLATFTCSPISSAVSSPSLHLLYTFSHLPSPQQFITGLHSTISSLPCGRCESFDFVSSLLPQQPFVFCLVNLFILFKLLVSVWIFGSKSSTNHDKNIVGCVSTKTMLWMDLYYHTKF